MEATLRILTERLLPVEDIQLTVMSTARSRPYLTLVAEAVLMILGSHPVTSAVVTTTECKLR